MPLYTSVVNSAYTREGRGLIALVPLVRESELNRRGSSWQSGSLKRLLRELLAGSTAEYKPEKWLMV